MGRRVRRPTFEGFGGPEAHEAEDAGGGFGGTDGPVVVVPAGHDALELLAAEVWGDAREGLVLVAGAKETMPVVWAVAGAMVGGCLEAFVAELWGGEQGSSIRGELSLLTCRLGGCGRVGWCRLVPELPEVSG
jgi:hypothetical protein